MCVCFSPTGSILHLMCEEGVYGVLGLLEEMLCWPGWETRHGGLLGLKYLLAVREDLHTCLLPRIYPHIYRGEIITPFFLFLLSECKKKKKEEEEEVEKNYINQHPSLTVINEKKVKEVDENNINHHPSFTGILDEMDDVVAVAASCLVPVAASVVEKLKVETVGCLVSTLWDALLDIDDLTSSTSSVLMLLARLMAHPVGHGRSVLGYLYFVESILFEALVIKLMIKNKVVGFILCGNLYSLRH